MKANNYKNGEEVWHDTKLFGALIQFSNYEKIRSWKRANKNGGVPENIAVYIGSKGYLVASVRELQTQKVKQLKIHRLIAQQFLPNPNNYPEVNHIDGNKLNNNPDNLEWCDKKHNIRHAFTNKLINSCKGVNKPQSKLTESEVLEIFHSKGNGKLIAPKYNIDFTTIYSIRSGKTWNHVTGAPKNNKNKIVKW
jgi:hypothetical protein